MEASLGSSIIKWRGLQAFSISWLILTSTFIALSFPTEFYFAAIIAGILVTLTGAVGVLRGNRSWSTAAPLALGSMFFILLLIDTLAGTVSEVLHFALLQFIMILFTVELLNSVSKQYDFFGKALAAQTRPSLSVLRLSLTHSFAQLTRLGLLFSSCYLISLGVLYVGSEVAAIAPVLGDVSLFIVIVSIALALLITFKEERE
jgi:hypothetical protein